MTKTVKKAKKGSVGKKVAVAGGIAVVAGALAGAYALYGSKKGPAHRAKVKAWSLKAKSEVLKQLKTLPKIDEKTYHKIISEVAKKYKTLKGLDPKDVVAFAGELKSQWKDVAKKTGVTAAISRVTKRIAKKK